MKPIYILFTLLLAFMLTACGGGGGGSSDEPMTETPTTTPTEPDPPGPTQAEIDAEAMALAAAIGLDSDGDPVTVTAADGDALPGEQMNGKTEVGTRDNDFKADSMAVASINGWDSDATMRTMRNVKDQIVLYSNIDDPTDVSYSDYFDTSADNEDGRDLDGVANTPEVVLTESGDDAGNITFTATGFDVTKGNAKHFVFKDFTPDPSQGNSFVLQDDTNTQTVDESERIGSFFGIDGKFTCTSTCIVRVTPSGGLDVTGAGTLGFEPDVITLTGENATKVEGVIPDKDYMVFGYWLKTTTEDDGSETLSFSPHASGVLAYGGTGNTVTQTEIRGTAKYEGPATGMFVKKTLTTDGGTVTGGPPFSRGQFTARAMLTAYFDQTVVADPGGVDQIAPAMLNSIGGTISGFKGEGVNENWSLMLERSRIDTSAGWTLLGSDASTATAKQGMTSGNTGDTRLAGAWTAAFYGSNTGDNPATPSRETDFAIPPGSVAGTFNGHFQDGHVAGSFGATKQ